MEIITMSKQTKGNFSKFMAGKGFYVALTFCLIGAGAAAWAAVDRTIDSIDQNNKAILDRASSSLPLSSSESNWGFPSLEEADKPQSGVSKPSASSSSADTSSSSSEASSETSSSSEPSEQPVQSPVLDFVLPVQGEILTSFSQGELVKDVTLGEWRTHDGVDIKADKGAEVFAAAAGSVTKVAQDTLWGQVVEITHGDGSISRYCGLAKDLAVKEGDLVNAGQTIGQVDSIPTEISLPTHIHFELIGSDGNLDPLAIIGR